VLHGWRLLNTDVRAALNAGLCPVLYDPEGVKRGLAARGVTSIQKMTELLGVFGIDECVFPLEGAAAASLPWV
jgi:hypothetical protein